MSSWRVNKVRTEKSSTGSHDHISAVHASNSGSATEGIWLSRATVVGDIRTSGDDYYTLAGGSRAAVKVVQCPNCTFSDYLRSERDKTTADNLMRQHGLTSRYQLGIDSAGLTRYDPGHAPHQNRSYGGARSGRPEHRAPLGDLAGAGRPEPTRRRTCPGDSPIAGG